MDKSRRKFFSLFAVLALPLITVDAEARRGRTGSGYRRGGGSRGCGSKGGPGYRKPNGQCASWKD